MRRTANSAVLLALVAAVAAGAGSARAADPSPEPMLGATVESHIYTNEDRSLSLINRSNVPAHATFEPTGGWNVEPAELTLEPGERAEVQVLGDGIEGAEVAVTVAAVASPPPGAQASELALSALVYSNRPDAFPWLVVALMTVGLAVVVAIGTLAVMFRRRYRLTTTAL